MTIATYSGFSIVALMCLACSYALRNPKMGWFIGQASGRPFSLTPWEAPRYSTTS